MRSDLVAGIVMGDSPVRARGLDGTRIVDSVREAGSTAPAAALVEGFWHADSTSDAIKEDVRAMMLGCPPEVLAGMLERVIPGDRMLDLVKAADRKPFMAIWAETPAGDPAWLREQTMFLRQEPLVAGHFFQLELPGVTNALIRAFLEEAERDPRAF
jgi:pimeloyl-ACP methyl ester carboxylesterase